MTSETNIPGMELFVRKIDENAKWHPNHTLVRFASGPNWETEGYRSLTWQQYAEGINATAHWLDETFGKSVGNETVAYSGPSDVRYAFLFAASVKTGRKFLVPDGRFMKDGLDVLLQSSNCKIWLYSEGGAFCPEPELAASGVKVQQFKSLNWCLSVKGANPYPYEKTYEDAKDDEILIIHTGGTTGAPKPIFMNNGFWAAGCSSAGLARRHWPRGISTDCFHGRSLILAIPMRLQPGLVMINMFSVFSGTTVIQPPPDVVGLPPDIFEKMLRLNKVDGLMAFPFTVVDLYNNERTRESLKSLEFITYLGSALDRVVGDALCEHTRLNSVMGATESGGRFSLHPIDRKLWYSFQFIPEHHVRLVRLEGSGAALGDGDDADVYQMFIDRPPDGGPSIYQCAFWNYKMFKDVQSIDTKELWKPVKDRDGSTRWESVARTDDWTKLIWMAKFHAQDIENKVVRYPGVRHAMVGGAGRIAPYVLIEVNDELLGRDPKELLDDIYEKIIESHNKVSAKAVAIPRQTVFLASKEKPIKLTVKQLVLRREVERDYKEEIEAVFKELESETSQTASEKFVQNMN
ncbi:acetyl-CoA synthetase-like protein [Didymella exigua CBS 183.55]|uniref:Acetyl-CoA synthetase-like protein n=1 Tax=Didymella exigua CBS 183.55 TaxID=1150837 RepID=A0A6A5RA01_9PLEO|nr:acetyl-CoA synthetase-like protein [Didymella exigua CBS 183.55]KAF1922667.1 acetyl-CoA synthetase-like protein [Didymella exigua CBS 183.55]